MTEKNIAERLRANRKIKGLSQEELGERVGVTKSAIQKQEQFSNWQSCNPDRPILSYGEVEKRGELLGGDVDYYYFGKKVEGRVDGAINIIVIDDDPAHKIRAMRMATFIDEHVHVVGFASAKEAIEWSMLHAPELVITDYKLYDHSLPDHQQLDGIDVIELLQNPVPRRKTPFVVITSYEDQFVAEIKKKRRRIKSLQKPYTGAALVDTCRGLLKLPPIQRKHHD